MKVIRGNPNNSQVTVDYDDNSFTFEFAALEFTNSKKKSVSVYTGSDLMKIGHRLVTRRFISYTNLDAGDYTFRVKGTNNDGYGVKKMPG